MPIDSQVSYCVQVQPLKLNGPRGESLLLIITTSIPPFALSIFISKFSHSHALGTVSSSMASLTHFTPIPTKPRFLYRRPLVKLSTSLNSSFTPSNISHSTLSFRIRCSQDGIVTENHGLDGSMDNSDLQKEDIVSEENGNGPSVLTSSFLAKLAIAVGIAATITVLSIFLKQTALRPSHGVQLLVDSSSVPASVMSAGFSFKVFGYQILLPEYAPGWVYFWLLMAAGCGLFISEEALNIWVGISLSKLLCLDGTWHSFAESFSRNAPYIMSTILWVYWGVCISDMIPFYIGKVFSKTKASDDVCSKLGIGKEKALKITQAVQSYGNLSGFVERFSIGMRNPTAFLAGALGISPECFFAGVCLGGMVTLSVQLGIGFLVREQPVIALATVATAVGIWTVFPYAVAASTALFLFLQRKYSS